MSTILQELCLHPWSGEYAQLADMPCHERVTVTTTSYSGSVKYYFVGIGSAVAGSSGNVRLRRYGTTTDDVSVASTTLLGTSPGWFSVEFTPPSGSTTYFVYIDNPGTADKTVAVRRASIWVKQTGAPITATETQINIGYYDNSGSFNTSGIPQTYPHYWKYDASLWDGTKEFWFEAAIWSPTTKSNATCKLQVADGTGDGFAGWADVTNGSVSTSSYPAVLVRAASAFTPVDGRWYRIVLVSPTTKSAAVCRNARVVVKSTNSPTKIEGQYLVTGTLQSGTALNPVEGTYFDPADWAGVTNVYKYQICASDGNTCVGHIQKTADGDSGSALSGSTITSPDNAQISGTVTMPATAAQLSCRLTTSVSNVGSGRLLVQVTMTASQIKKVETAALASIKKISSVAIASVKKLAGVSNT